METVFTCRVKHFVAYKKLAPLWGINYKKTSWQYSLVFPQVVAVFARHGLNVWFGEQQQQQQQQPCQAGLGSGVGAQMQKVQMQKVQMQTVQKMPIFEVLQVIEQPGKATGSGT